MSPPKKKKGEIGVQEFRLQVQETFFGLAGLRDESDKKHRQQMHALVKRIVKDLNLKIVGQQGESVPDVDADEILVHALNEVMEFSSEPPPEETS